MQESMTDRLSSMVQVNVAEKQNKSKNSSGKKGYIIMMRLPQASYKIILKKFYH